MWAVSFREGNPPKRRFPKKLIECQLDSQSRIVPQKQKVIAWHFSWNKDKQKANPPVWYFLETLEPRLQPIVLECVSTIFTCLTPLSTFKVAPLRPNIQTTNYYYRSFHQTGRIFPTFTLHLSLFFTRFFLANFSGTSHSGWSLKSKIMVGRSIHRNTSDHIREKKKRRKMSTEESFFLESWSLKMRGFFLSFVSTNKNFKVWRKKWFPSEFPWNIWVVWFLQPKKVREIADTAPRLPAVVAPRGGSPRQRPFIEPVNSCTKSPDFLWDVPVLNQVSRNPRSEARWLPYKKAQSRGRTE